MVSSLTSKENCSMDHTARGRVRDDESMRTSSLTTYSYVGICNTDLNSLHVFFLRKE